jgi:hypothetical protein
MSTRIEIKSTSSFGNTAKIIKTGQSVSYRTGDDGDLQEGRLLTFTMLESNNPFGNDKRFTDELGTLVYANNIVIDWSTYNGTEVLGYKRTLSATTVNWNNAIDGALAVSIGSFTTGWRLPNINELLNICNYENGSGSYANLINYFPFNITGDLWSSTSLYTLGGSFSWTITPTNMTYQGTGTSIKYIAVRNFTVTGTTLT